MQITILFAALTIFFIIISLLYPLGKKMDQKSRRLKAIKNNIGGNEIVDEELKLPLSERIIKPMKNSLYNTLRKLRVKNREEVKKPEVKASKSREKVIKALQAAAINLRYEDFNMIKLGSALVLGMVGFLIVFFTASMIQYAVLAALFGMTLGFVAPTFIIGKKGKARNNNILRSMPEVMDLLVVSVEAGLGLDAAITRLYERNKSPLTNELIKTVRDVQMGLSRRDSLKAMGERSEVKELQAFASALIQADQLGVSIKKVIRTQADQIRLGYKQSCETKAMKAPVKMMLPMVAFILPVLFIILLGPAVPKIAEIFS